MELFISLLGCPSCTHCFLCRVTHDRRIHIENIVICYLPSLLRRSDCVSITSFHLCYDFVVPSFLVHGEGAIAKKEGMIMKKKVATHCVEEDNRQVKAAIILVVKQTLIHSQGDYDTV